MHKWIEHLKIMNDKGISKRNEIR